MAVAWVSLFLSREGQVPDDLQNRAENCHNFKFLSDSTEKYNFVTILISPSSAP